MADITVGMKVFRHPSTKSEKERNEGPVEFEVIGFGTSLSPVGNQVPKVLVKVAKGAGALKNGINFCILAMDPGMLSKD